VQIAQAMFERIAKEEGKFFEKLTENAKQKLLNYDWPGNVRQLENMIRNTLVMNHSEVIDAHMFPAFPVSNSNVQQIAPPNQANALSTPNPSFDEVQTGSAVTTANEPVATMQSHFDIRPMWIVEKEYIEQAIEICGNNIPKAAAMLELSPSTIYRKMKTWEQ
jgi:two-component system repressor protein LuxO